METKRALIIIGSGSTGKRHAKNLMSLGFTKIYFLRRNKKAVDDPKLQMIPVITCKEESLKLNPIGVVICTPSSEHFEYIKFYYENGVHIFCEKPLVTSRNQIEILDQLKPNSISSLQVGFMKRFHPGVVYLKELINKNKEVQYVQTFWAEYLPYWNPQIDYKKSYAAKKELGGGVGLTYSHDIDLILWLFEINNSSDIINFNKINGYSSCLDINVESTVSYSYQLKSTKTIINSIVSFDQKIYKQFLNIGWENGDNFYLDFVTNKATYTYKDNSEIINYVNYNRNDMFISEIKEWLHNCSNMDIESARNEFNQAEILLNLIL